MHFPRLFFRRVSVLLPWLVFFAGQAPAQEPALAPGHPNYYAGAPLNFVARQPRPGTFYYNDFNRYGYIYFPAGSRAYVPVSGANDGGEGSRDFNGQAIIGQERGTLLVAGEPLAAGSNYIRRNNTFFQVTPGNAADPLLEFDLAGGPSGNATLQAMNNSLVANVGAGVGFHFPISTAGYSGIRISFDLGVAAGASANYRLQASADGGTTWTYVNDTTLVGLKSNQWFNGVPAETNPQALFDLSDHPEFDNNPRFIVQIYGIPDPDTGVWTSESGQTASAPYPTSLALDRINLTGTPVVVAGGLQQWRQTHFGTAEATGNAANDADPDGDGLPNLLEYALGADPLSAGVAPLPVATAASDRLRISFNRIADPALLYEVEASSDLTGSWSVIWSSTGPQNTDGTVTVDDVLALGSQSRRFLRLKVGGG